MIGIERGTVVAERYVISDIVRPWFADHPDSGTVCIALDAILDIPVTLYLAPSETSGDLLDAARRSALLTDPRIPTVLDVGRTEGLDFVVFERTVATPLPAMLRNGPLDPEAARAFVGELATALSHASSRGLYHLCLGPECVGLKDNLDAIITGVAIDAAVADAAYGLELEAMPTAAKKREDALALMNIFYAALTGHWPGDEPRAGLPVAERRNNRFVRVSELVSGVPSGLEEFVSGVVMKIEPGPRSASEVVRFLDEWDVHRLRELPTGSPRPSGDELRHTEDEKFSGTEAGTGASSARPTTKTDATTASGTAAATPAPPRPSTPPATTPDAPAPAPEKRATPAQLRAALTRIGLTRPGASGLAAGRVADSETPYDDRMQMRQAAVFPISSDQLESAEANEEWQPEDTFASYEEYADAEADENETQRIADRSQLFDGDESLTADDTQVIDAEAAAAEAEPDEDEEDDGSWFLGGMFTTREEELERQRAEYERERRLQEEAAERARALERSRRKRKPNPAAASGVAADLADIDEPAPTTTAERDEPGDTASGKTAAASTPTKTSTAAAASAPATAAAVSSAGGASVPPVDPDDRDRGSKRGPLIIGVLAVLVVAALIIGLIVGTQGDDEPSAQEPTAEPAPTDEQKTEEQPPPAPKPEITGVTALDPEGDGSENNDSASKVLEDGGSGWRTDRYNSAKFGNLKSGVGLALQLKEATTVSKVEVASERKGSDFEVRIGDSEDPKGAKVVGKGTTENGTTSVDLAENSKGSVVFIWFTKLGSADGGYRAYVNHVSLS